MGILLSLVCLVGGAAMLATNTSPGANVDPHAGGLVLIGVGLIWLVLSAVLWDIGSERDEADDVARQRIIYTGGARTPRRPTHHR